MERRKFMIGIGSLAAGSAAATGTGAFSSMSASRTANVNVVNDSSGLIALKPGSGADGRVNLDGGELEINFTGNEDGDGVNINSTYQVGGIFGLGEDVDNDPGGPTTNPAFKIVNQDTSTHDITVEYNLTGSLNTDGSWLGFNARPLGPAGDSIAEDSGRMPVKDAVVDAENPNPSFTYDGNNAITSGGGFGVSLFVDTTGSGADTTEDLTGTLTISSE